MLFTQLCVAYLRYAEGYYVKRGKPTAEVDCIRSSLRVLREFYADELVKDFGPVRLKAVFRR
jgi:hypothetical protein